MNKSILFFIFLCSGQWLTAMEVCPQEPNEKILFINDCPIQLHLELMLKNQKMGHQVGPDHLQAVRLYSFLNSYEIKEFHWLPEAQWFGDKQHGGHYIHLQKKDSSPSFDLLNSIIEAQKAKKIKWLNVTDTNTFMQFIRAEDMRRRKYNKKAIQFSAGVGSSILAFIGWYLLFGEYFSI